MADNYCKCCGDGTPEYIIELNQQGAPGKRGEKGEQGYSPIVDFIVDNNEIKFTSTNEDNVTSTPNLYDYVLKKDGTNSTNPITLNQTFIRDNNIYTSRNDLVLGNNDTNSYKLNIKYGHLTLSSYTPEISNTSGDLTIQSAKNLYLGTISGSKISLNNSINIIGGISYIGTQDPNNKIATIGNIPEVSDSKITISQGDVVKGSFTLNQSGDTTIELDTGITNPLKIEGATVDNPSGGTITYGMELGLDSNNKVYLDYTSKFGGGVGTTIITENLIKDNQIYAPLHKTATIVDSDVNRTLQFGYNNDGEISIESITTGTGGGIYHNIAPITTNITNYPIYLQKVTGISGLEGMYYIKLNYDNNTLKLNDNKQLYADFTEVNNSIAELTTLANNTEASLNGLKTDYESNKTEVAGELTNLGNQLNNKQNTLIAGNNITIVDNVISATGGTGDVTSAGDNRFTGDNTFTGKVNIAGGALTVEGLANINQATVQYLNAVNITSPGEINATSIKANGLRSDDIQTTENKKYLTEADVDNQTIQIVEGKLHANLPDLSNYVTLTTYNELLARVEALEAEINGGNA